MARIASILDIAKLAGVSKTTVSKVLNNQYGVHEETRKKVWEAAAALRYTPNIAARALVTSRTNVIGVVYDSFDSPIYTGMAGELEHWAKEMSYHLVFCSCNRDQASKRHYIQHFMGGAADGVILYGSSGEDYEIIKLLMESGYPFVVIENHFEHLEIPNVLVDNYSGAVEAVQYLYNLGHREIVHITGNLQHRVAVDRRKGYLDAMNRLGLEVTDGSIIETDGSIGCGEQAADRLVERPVLPTALFVFNDLIAYEMMDRLEQAGIGVPDKISIVGFDHLIGLLSFKPGRLALTSLAQPLEEVARAAVEIVVADVDSRQNADRIEKTGGSQSVPAARLFAPKLWEGNSCRRLEGE